MKKKTKDIESTLYCFLFIFILIFIFEVPRKAFNILRLDFNQRLQKVMIIALKELLVFITQKKI